MDIKNLKFSAEEIDSLLNKIKNLDLSNIEASANIDLAIGQVETVENIENASASIVRNGDSYRLNLSIPKGEKGDKGSNGGTPTFSIGTVSAGSTPQVIMTGDFPNYILNFVLPTSGGGSGSGGELYSLSIASSSFALNSENGFYEYSFTNPYETTSIVCSLVDNNGDYLLNSINVTDTNVKISLPTPTDVVINIVGANVNETLINNSNSNLTSEQLRLLSVVQTYENEIKDVGIVKTNIDNLTNNKFDEVTLTDSRLNFKANGINKASIALPMVADSSLSTESTNPIQNKIVTNALNDINSQLDTMENITYKEVTPEMFGAKGDGVTDDTQAIKNAITFLQNCDVVYIKNKYRVTSTITIPKGIKIEGVVNGIYVNNCTLLADISDKSPVITFEEVSTGIELKDFKIKPYSEANKKKFNGIDVNRAEYLKINNVSVEDAFYGYYLSSSLGPIYCCDFIDVIILRCDIGFYIKKTNSWSNALKLKIRDISDNRVGIQCEQGNGNTIVGESTEIGRNTECGIRLLDGFTTIKGSLWLENSPVGIEVCGGTHYIEGDIYNICRTVVNGGELIQNGYSSIGNLHTSLNASRKDEVCWYSFDDFNSKLLLLNKTTGMYENKYLSNLTRVKNCSFGSGITTTSNFSLPKMNFSKDWTILISVKKIDSEVENSDVLRFSNNDNSENYTFYIKREVNGQFNILGFRDSSKFLYNFNMESRNKGEQCWLVLSYDSNLKEIQSRSLTGVVMNKFSISLDGYTLPSIVQILGANGNNLYDEIIMYSRYLNGSEIINITNKLVYSIQDTTNKTIAAYSPDDYVNPVNGSIVVNMTPNKTKNIQQWIYSSELNSWLALGCGVGNTTQRENLRLTKNDSNYQFFDTTLNKIVIWNGTTWIGI